MAYRHRNQSRYIAAQRKWIEEHGADLAGYIERYGMERGPAIYAADLGELQRLLAKQYAES